MLKRFSLIIIAFILLPIIVTPSFSYTPSSSENAWVQKAPMQQARGHVGVAVVNGKIYAIGGYNESGRMYGNNDTKIVATTEKYDPATDMWTFEAPMPSARYGFAIATYKDKIYCMGGGKNEVYDTATNAWGTKTPMPTDRAGVQANTIDGKIYVVGGFNYSQSNTDLNEVYDPETDTWTTKAPLPYASCSYASAVFNGKLYVFGGQAEDVSGLFLQNMTQVYDPKNDLWSMGASSPYDTFFAQAGVTTGIKAPQRIYLFDVGSHSRPSGQIYDPSSDSWSVGVAQPTNRMAFSIVVVDDLLYAIGGISYKDASPFDAINPNTYVTVFALNERYTPFGYGTIQSTTTPDNSIQPTQSPEIPQTNQLTRPEQMLETVIITTVITLIVSITLGLIIYFKRIHH